MRILIRKLIKISREILIAVKRKVCIGIRVL